MFMLKANSIGHYSNIGGSKIITRQENKILTDKFVKPQICDRTDISIHKKKASLRD